MSVSTAQSTRFAAIDGLRGVAILMVTFFHLWRIPGQLDITIGGLDITPLLAYGTRGVGLFFALSGFCLYYPLVKSLISIPSKRMSWRTFFTRRAWRIWPAYWVSIAIFLPLWAVGSGWGNLIPDLYTHVTFTHTLFVDTIHSINGVLWTLGVEWHFYLAFPILAYLLRKYPISFSIFTVILTLFIRYASFELSDNFNLWDKSLIGHLPEFTLGMLAAHIIVTGWKPNKRTEILLFIIAFIGFFVTPYAFSIADDLYSRLGILINSISWLCLILVVMIPGVVQTILSFRPLSFIGVISYSMYLYNYMMYWIPKWLYPSVARGSILWWIMTFVIVLLCGIVGYYLIERTTLKFREYICSKSIPYDKSKSQVSPHITV